MRSVANHSILIWPAGGFSAKQDPSSVRQLLNGVNKNYRFDWQAGLRDTLPQNGVPDDGAPGRVPMANADEPWIREWINSVADDMMRDHPYMQVNLRGVELVSVSLTEVGASCAILLDEGTE